MQVAFSILLALTMFAAGSYCSDFDTLEGVPKEAEIISNRFIFTSAESCWEKLCEYREACVLIHNKVSQRCYQVQPSLLILWKKDRALEKRDKWQTLISASTSIRQPVALWLFDSVHRLKNLGSKGAAMDMQVKGAGASNDQGFFWTAEGPWASKARYLKYPGKGIGSDYNCWFNTKKNGEQLLDFTAAFTITTCIKTEQAGELLIMDVGTHGTDLWFDPDIDQLGMGHKGYWSTEASQTVKLSKHNLGWRHIAVSYKGTGTPTFYLNGNVWPLAKASTAKMVNPSLEHVFRGDHKLRQARACFMIFQQHLSKIQIQTVMKGCP